MDRVLVATDFSEWSGRAESRAAMLCQNLHCTSVELCTAIEPAPLASLALVLGVSDAAAEKMVTQKATQELELRSAKLRDIHGAPCSSTVRFGSPAREIIDRAEEIDADLVLAGAHGSNFLADLFLGNTVDKLVHLAKRPLLVIKNKPVRPYRHVLVPVDFSPDSLNAAKLAIKIAPAAAITFLHAFDVPFEGMMQYASVSSEVIDMYRARAHGEARALLNQFISDLGPEANERLLTRSIVFGSPSAAVREHAKQMRPELIVMGKHGRSWIEKLLIGSVTRDTMDQTASDLLIVSSGN